MQFQSFIFLCIKKKPNTVGHLKNVWKEEKRINWVITKKKKRKCTTTHASTPVHFPSGGRFAPRERTVNDTTYPLPAEAKNLRSGSVLAWPSVCPMRLQHHGIARCAQYGARIRTLSCVARVRVCRTMTRCGTLSAISSFTCDHAFTFALRRAGWYRLFPSAMQSMSTTGLRSAYGLAQPTRSRQGQDFRKIRRYGGATVGPLDASSRGPCGDPSLSGNSSAYCVIGLLRPLAPQSFF